MSNQHSTPTDASAPLVTSYTPTIYVYNPPVPIPGWPESWNIVAVSPEGEHVLLMDPDGSPWPTWGTFAKLEAIYFVPPEFKAALLSGARPPSNPPAVPDALVATPSTHTIDSAIESPAVDLEGALDRIRRLRREGHETNARRQLVWVGIRDGEIVAIQTIGSTRKDPSYLALARNIDEVISLTTAGALIAENKWGRPEPIPHQGIYVVANRLVGRIDELFAASAWAIMKEGVITDATIVARRAFYLDLDTQRFDEAGNAVDLPISATREELHGTVTRALVILEEIVKVLRVVGVERPRDVVAFMMSGNGVQLWFALADLSESPALHSTIKELLAIWGALYDSDVSHVDTGVHDAKRIGPLAGTTKRKGIKEALYRLVTFDGADDPRRLTLEELQSLVVHYRRKLSPEQRAIVGKTLGVRQPPAMAPKQGRGGGLSACNQIPIRDVAVRLGLDAEKPTCPGCGSGGGTDVAFLDRTGANLLNCKHARCSGRPNRTPVDLVAKVAFGCDSIKGTRGVVTRVLAWFKTNFGVGGR